MEIIIGRDQQTRQLCVIKDGNSRLYGQSNSVPMDVSRHHFSIQPAGAGKWIVKNLNERNVTFVNGLAIESKTISENDKIELGNSHYLFSWAALQEPKVETIDIKSLKRVWDEYQENDISIRNHQKTNGLWASIPLGFSMFGGIIAGVAPDIREVALVFTGIAFVTFLYGLYKRSQDNSTIELKENQDDFDRKWICPKCKHPLTCFRSYTILSQSDACPYCKTKYKK
ncbi:FHA domain-containing protein [Prevotellaceae bacterium HUN156]|nr:FHA domain-containing protein [Prevotellaceae bacterium HUN156]